MKPCRHTLTSTPHSRTTHLQPRHTQLLPPRLARTTSSSSSSALSRGTTYEHAVAASLRRLGFTLTRIGARNDCGIDLVGSWTLPLFRSAALPPTNHADEQEFKVPVFVQCKNLVAHRRSTPATLREVEGAFPALRRAFAAARAEAAAAGRESQDSGLERSLTAPHSIKDVEDVEGTVTNRREDDPYGPEVQENDGDGGDVDGAIGLLATTRPATKGVRDALMRSRMPLGYLQILPPVDELSEEVSRVEEAAAAAAASAASPVSASGASGEGATRIVQLLWNARATGAGVGDGALGRCKVGVRYVGSTGGSLSDGGEGEERDLRNEIVLQYQGEVWEPFGGG